MKTLPWLTETGQTEAGSGVPKELEIALVLIMTEQERRKGEGLLRGKGPEQIVFLCKLFWPLYLLKWTGTSNYVLFDGLGLFQYDISYDTVAQCEEFEKQLTSDAPVGATAQDYLELLRTHSETFADFTDVTPYSLLGCLNQDDVLRDLIPYFEMISDTDLSLDASLPMRIAPELARSHIETLATVRERCLEDIQELAMVVKVLTESESRCVNHIENRQVMITEQFRQQIDDRRAGVELKAKKYIQLMQEEVASIEMRFSPLISNLQAEVPRWEREEGRWKRMGRGYEKSRDSARRAKDKAKRQLSDAIRERDSGIDKATEYYTELIEQAWAPIDALERERDAQVGGLGATKEEIEKLASHIRAALMGLIQRKEDFVDSLNATGMRLSHIFKSESDSDPIFMYVPFWIAQFESAAGGRFFILPPSVIKRRRGMKDKLAKMLTGHTVPIEARTERFDKILKRRLQQSLHNDQLLANEAREKGVRHNILRQTATRKDFGKGLHLLRDTGWVTEKYLAQVKDSLDSLEIWLR